MTQLESCINAIKNESFGIGIEYFPKHKTTVYSFMKISNEKERTVRFEMAKDVAKLLIKNGAKIVYVQKNCNALNFTPEKQINGHITYWKN